MLNLGIRGGMLKAMAGSFFLALGVACGGITLQEPVLLKDGFEDGLEGWEARANLIPGNLEWAVRPVPQPSFEGAGSAQFYVEATEGEGAVWLQKHIPVPINKDGEVTAEISLYVRIDGTLPQQPQLLFWVKGSAPFDRASFLRKEPLALNDTWQQYSFTERVSTSGKSLWFAFGTEVPRGAPVTVHVDSVSVQVTR